MGWREKEAHGTNSMGWPRRPLDSQEGDILVRSLIGAYEVMSPVFRVYGRPLEDDDKGAVTETAARRFRSEACGVRKEGGDASAGCEGSGGETQGDCVAV